MRKIVSKYTRDYISFTCHLELLLPPFSLSVTVASMLPTMIQLLILCNFFLEFLAIHSYSIVAVSVALVPYYYIISICLCLLFWSPIFYWPYILLDHLSAFLVPLFNVSLCIFEVLLHVPNSNRLHGLCYPFLLLLCSLFSKYLKRSRLQYNDEYGFLLLLGMSENFRLHHCCFPSVLMRICAMGASSDWLLWLFIFSTLSIFIFTLCVDN